MSMSTGSEVPQNVAVLFWQTMCRVTPVGHEVRELRELLAPAKLVQLQGFLGQSAEQFASEDEPGHSTAPDVPVVRALVQRVVVDLRMEPYREALERLVFGQR
jgi:hypothetical protein